LLVTLVASGQWQKSRAELKSLSKKQLFQLVSVAIIGGALPFYLFFTGLAQIPAVNAGIIHKSLVLWVAILAIPLLKEKVSKTLALAVLILFAGNLMIGGFNGFTLSKGEIMVFLATLLWAMETILAKEVLKAVNANVVATARMGLGSLILIFIAVITAPSDILKMVSLNSSQWFWISLTAVALFAYVSTWYRALKLAPAITVSAVLVLSTLITNLLSAIFITHAWNLTLTLQGFLIVFGVVFVTLAQIIKIKKTPYKILLIDRHPD